MKNSNNYNDFKKTNIPESKNLFESYIKSLSKEKLEELVIKFAPDTFKLKIENSHKDLSYAKSQFLKISNNLENLFYDEELLFEPYNFEAALMNNINKLEGLTDKLPEETFNLIIYVLENIEKSFDEGYLYNQDYWRDDEFFVSTDFENFIIEFLNKLPLQTKVDYFKKISKIISNSSYDTFSRFSSSVEKIFNESEIKYFKNIFLDDISSFERTIIKNLYNMLKKELYLNEKENILKYILDDDVYALELAELYEENNRIDEAIKFIQNKIDELLAQNKQYELSNYYKKYLDLLVKTVKDITDISIKAITNCPQSDLLLKISELINDTNKHENILEQKRPNDLLEFYEKTKRTNDAFLLIQKNNKICEDGIYKFYEKHKKDYPDYAKVFYSKILNKNLVHTGDHYYEEVVELLKQIKTIDYNLFMEKLHYILKNYSRRRNLIRMLQNI